MLTAAWHWVRPILIGRELERLVERNERAARRLETVVKDTLRAQQVDGRAGP